MLAIKIILIALCAVILIVALILSLDIKVVFEFDTNGRLTLLAKLLFYKLYDIRQKKEPSPFGRYLKRIFGISALTDTEEIKKDTQESGISDTVSRLIAVLSLLAGQISWLLKRVRIKKLHILAICGGSDAADAAMDYGLVCAAVYPFVGYLETNAKFKEKAGDIRVGCDFENDAHFEAEITVKIKLFHVIRAIFRSALDGAESILDNADPKNNNGGIQQ